tara:strand:- start:95 stop:403 length:309 start_codon:yes stop_codon:yes gene_type:complete
MAFKMKRPSFHNSPLKQAKSKEQLLNEGFDPREADQMASQGAATGKTDVTDGNNAEYEKQSGKNFQAAKDKIKAQGLKGADAKKVLDAARAKNKALAVKLQG